MFPNTSFLSQSKLYKGVSLFRSGMKTLFFWILCCLTSISTPQYLTSMIQKKTEMIPKRRKARKRKTGDGETADKVQKGGNAKNNWTRQQCGSRPTKQSPFHFSSLKLKEMNPLSLTLCILCWLASVVSDCTGYTASYPSRKWVGRGSNAETDHKRQKCKKRKFDKQMDGQRALHRRILRTLVV